MKVLLGEFNNTDHLFYAKEIVTTIYNFLNAVYVPHCFPIGETPVQEGTVIGALKNHIDDEGCKIYFGMSLDQAISEGRVVDGNLVDVFNIKTIGRRKGLKEIRIVNGVKFENRMGKNWFNYGYNDFVTKEERGFSYVYQWNTEGSDKKKLNFKLPYEPVLVTDPLPNVSPQTSDIETLREVAKSLNIPLVQDKSIRELNADIMKHILIKAEVTKPLLSEGKKHYHCMTHEEATRKFGELWKAYVKKSNIPWLTAKNDFLDISTIVSRVIPEGNNRGSYRTWSAPIPTEIKLCKGWVFLEVSSGG